MIAFKSLLFFILAPGTMAGFIPLIFLRNGAQVNMGLLSYLAPLFWIGGIAALIWCFWDFVQKGRGTPAPLEPPKELVVSGLYKHVRNPMYVGVLLVVIGHFLWFGYWSLLVYAGIFFLVVHAFVTLYEEPHLKETFGESYMGYLQRVPRWFPRFK